MKVLSSNAVTKDDLSSIDAKQTRQIQQLRIWLGASFAVNLIVSVGVFFLRNV